MVGLDEQGLQCRIIHEHISMEKFMDAYVNNCAMRDGRAVPPFVSPTAELSGSNIVFYIQLKIKLFLAFVNLKLSQTHLGRMLRRLSRQYLMSL